MKVFLDVDGVICNFNQGAFQALGLKYDYNHPALREWHWYKYFNISFEELDSVCGIDFWAGLRWMHDGCEILDIIEEQFGENNIHLLTTPMPNPGSATGKMLWVNRHIPRYSRRTIITQAQKSIFVSPDSLLVDDKGENIKEFSDAGGKVIIVPRPWNLQFSHHSLTIPSVKEQSKIIWGSLHE